MIPGRRPTRAVLALATAGALATACTAGRDGAGPPGPPTEGRPESSALVSVEMTDSGFAVSGPLVSGGTLRVSNVGSELHMLGLVRDGADAGFPGGLMSPGETVELTVPALPPGVYSLVCSLPSEGDGVPHSAKGRAGRLEVVAGATPPEPAAGATYRILPGEPVQGPATLGAGRHVLRFEAAEGSGQLEPGLARLSSGTTVSQLHDSLVGLVAGGSPPPPGAAAQLPGQVVFGGFDLMGVTTFYLATDLRPGSYAIAAEDTGRAERPRPPREVVNVRVL